MSITVMERDRMAARLAEIRPFLDERAWRLLLGAEARAIGYGGMKVVAAAAKPRRTRCRGAQRDRPDEAPATTTVFPDLSETSRELGPSPAGANSGPRSAGKMSDNSAGPATQGRRLRARPGSRFRAVSHCEPRQRDSSPCRRSPAVARVAGAARQHGSPSAGRRPALVRGDRASRTLEPRARADRRWS